MGVQEYSFGILLLAAGSSTRMGRPKQLLRYQGMSLLRKAIGEALRLNPAVMRVVLGAEAAVIKEEIKDLKVDWIVNSQYEEGIASSIRHGLQDMLEENIPLQCVIMMVCDQPYVNARHLEGLLHLYHASNASIVGSDYRKTRGVPALFDKSLFPELMLLKGDVGARSLIERHREKTVGVAFPLGAVDVDTVEDYQRLKEKLMDKGGDYD